MACIYEMSDIHGELDIPQMALNFVDLMKPELFIGNYIKLGNAVTSQDQVTERAT
ncbi:hypothetical protein [Paenibacillus sp. 37]|uniref:hypothetical protein n=1 Tax=Paenibacillus sp. 37 TaxID=2607911 RepID=UPI001661A6CD|nr:hypothetical protein [Paenibacillus sp. 37]